MSTSHAGKPYAVIGDNSPVEHGGGIIYKDGDSYRLVYFEPYDGDKVTISESEIYEDVLDWMDWAEVSSIAESWDIKESDLRKYSKSPDPVARAQVIEAIAGYHGWRNVDDYPVEKLIDETDELYGDDIDAAHQASSTRGRKKTKQNPRKKTKSAGSDAEARKRVMRRLSRI